MQSKALLTLQSTRNVSAYLDAVSAGDDGAPRTGAAILDAAKNEPGFTLPTYVPEIIKDLKQPEAIKVLDSINMGVEHFKAEHGRYPTADVVEAAIQQGYSAFLGIDARGAIMDSATSARHDQMSLQPNRAVVAILSAIAEAIPFASYLPVDIGSNQGKLAILSHQAGSAYGDYALGGLMDGDKAGMVYTSSQRMVKFDVTGAAPYNKAFTQANLAADPGYCDPAGATLPVLRGRTLIYVNGLVAAQDSAQGSAANSPFSSAITLPGGTTHTLVGYVTVATGVIQITSITPALPGGSEVTAQAFVDLETSPSLIPKVAVRADVYDIFANSSRVMTGISIDSASQLKNELGLDGDSEALMAVRTQMAMERHYQALRHAYALSANQIVAHNFDWANQKAQKTRGQVWQDFQAILGTADQTMADKTMDHGITHLYASSFVVNQWLALGREYFEPSGVAVRPGIYRVGRLYGKYDVYYAPTRSGAAQAADMSTATILAIGRSNQVARCPVVLGDAVAPTFLPLGMQQDLLKNSAMYCRDFTVTNPHQPSALGCARINLINLNN